MNDLKSSDRRARRAWCEQLEPRWLLNAGDLDLSFSGDGKATLTAQGDSLVAGAVAVQPDGKVVVAGGYSISNFFNYRVYLARFDINGNLDPSFGSAGTGVAYSDFTPFYGGQATSNAIAIQPDGKIIVAGSIDLSYGSILFVARYTPDGMLDGSFSGNGWDTIESIEGSHFATAATDVAVQKDGKIVIAGWSWPIIEDSDMAVFRYNSNGILDSSFAGDGKASIGFGHDEFAFALTIDYSGTAASNSNYGKIILVGSQTTSSNVSAPEFAIARLNTNGSLDNSFDGDGKLTLPFRPEYEYSSASGVVVQSDGRIVIAGAVGYDFSPTHNVGLMRLNPNGTPDFTFGHEVGKTEIDFGDYDWVADLIIGQTGRLIVGGSNQGKMTLACLTAEGILDTVFSGDGKQTVSFAGLQTRSNLALAPGGTIVAAGGEKFATARLFDRRAVTVSIGSFQPNGSESGPTATGFIVARLEPLPTPQRVYINIGGTARAPYLINGDYTASSNFSINHPNQGPSYVDIPANQGFVAVTITPIDDSLVENDETAVFSIGADPVYDVGTPPSTTLAIRDNDTIGPPFVTSAQFVYDEALPQNVRFTFNRDVTSSIDAGDFSIGGPSGPVPFSLSHDDITNTTTLSLNGILPDGNYFARASGAGITSTLGTPMAADGVLNFFFLSGDADHDRDVDVTDLGILAGNWQESPRTFSQGDFDYNGTVDVTDLGILASHWQLSLAASTPAPFGDARRRASGRIIIDQLL